MIIQEICASLPSRVVTNDDIVDLVAEHSHKKFQGDIKKSLKLLKIFLDRTGLIRRHWCEENESPIEHVRACIKEVLTKANYNPLDIELVVYVGIGRGFIEPANSYLIAKESDLLRAECFDLVDACMGWVRAAHLINNLFNSKQYKNALIINAEFNISHGIPKYNDIFTLENFESASYTIPRFTVGEAASATLLTPENEDNFFFQFSSFPELSDLCTFPIIEKYAGYCGIDDKIASNGSKQITSYGKELHDAASREAAKLFEQYCSVQTTDIVFPHTSSQSHWTEIGKKVGIADKMYDVYHKTGNIASASMPYGIYDALKQKKIKRSNNCVLWNGSAGMSFNVSQFVF